MGVDGIKRRTHPLVFFAVGAYAFGLLEAFGAMRESADIW